MSELVETTLHRPLDVQAEYRASLLRYPTETKEVDYKGAQPFVTSSPYASNLIKHILGMANAGGGFLVIGFTEGKDRALTPVSSLSDDVLRSYDPGLIASAVESCKAGTEKVEILVYKDVHPDTHVVHPVLQVLGFKQRPFFCKSDRHELKRGALYLRIASARTVEVAGPDEWDQLIDVCVTRRQDDLLRRFGSLVREVGLGEAKPTPSDLIAQRVKANERWAIQQREALSGQSWDRTKALAGLELLHWPAGEHKWTGQQLLKAAEAAEMHNTGWPLGIVPRNQEDRPKPKADGIETSVAGDRWYLKTDGTYLFFRPFEEDEHLNRLAYEGRQTGKPQLWIDTRAVRIVEALLHCGRLYRALGLDGAEIISVGINHLGLAERVFGASPGSRRYFSWSRTASESDVVWRVDVSLDRLIAECDQLAAEAIGHLCYFFEFCELEPSVMTSLVKEFHAF